MNLIKIFKLSTMPEKGKFGKKVIEQISHVSLFPRWEKIKDLIIVVFTHLTISAENGKKEKEVTAQVSQFSLIPLDKQDANQQLVLTLLLLANPISLLILKNLISFCTPLCPTRQRLVQTQRGVECKKVALQ